MRKDLNEKLLQRLQAVVVPTLQDADAVSRPPNSMWLRKPRKPRKLWLFEGWSFDPSILLDVLQNIVKVSAWNFGEGSRFLHVFTIFQMAGSTTD